MTGVGGVGDKRFWWIVVDRMGPDHSAALPPHCAGPKPGHACRAAVALMVYCLSGAESAILGNLRVLPQQKLDKTRLTICDHLARGPSLHTTARGPPAHQLTAYIQPATLVEALANTLICLSRFRFMCPRAARSTRQATQRAFLEFHRLHHADATWIVPVDP